MPDISPFRGLRYDLGQVGSLSDVICPPYDVIGPEFQDQLYKKHPANFVRLELNREEPGDTETENKYSRAAKHLKSWRKKACCFKSRSRRSTSTTKRSTTPVRLTPAAASCAV